MRFLGRRGYLQSQGWLPHSGTAQNDQHFASYWPLKDSAAWTVVSRGKNQTETGKGSLVNVPQPLAGVTWHYFDLWAGVELAKGSFEVRLRSRFAHVYFTFTSRLVAVWSRS